MVWDVLMAVLMCASAFAGALLLLAVLFRLQMRRYNRVVATELLDDWNLQLQLLDSESRQRALLSPPANVVAAMASLPAAGLLAGWDDGPLSSFDGR